MCSRYKEVAHYNAELSKTDITSVHAQKQLQQKCGTEQIAGPHHTIVSLLFAAQSLCRIPCCMVLSTSCAVSVDVNVLSDNQPVLNPRHHLMRHRCRWHVCLRLTGGLLALCRRSIFRSLVVAAPFSFLVSGKSSCGWLLLFGVHVHA